MCGLRIGNFKAFAETQQIPIRPLTLIYGANSAGKSSIIHSLLLANHALENGNVDVHQTKIGGQSLDLGGFSQYVHNHNSELQFEWGMEVEHSPIKEVVKYLGGFSRTGVKFRIGFAASDNSNSFNMAAPGIVAFELDLDGCRFMHLAMQSDGRLHPDNLNYEHPVIRAALEKLIEVAAARDASSSDFIFENPTEEELALHGQRMKEEKIRLTSDLEWVRTTIAEDIAKVPFSTEHLFPFGLVPEGGEDEYAYAYPDYDEQAILDSFDNCDGYAQWIARVLRYELEELFKKIGRAFTQRLRQMYYLGPLRCYPPRYLTGMHDQDPSWFSGGGQAWETLRRNPEVLTAVNQWLTAPDRLAKGYELVVRNLADIRKIAPELQTGLEDALGKLRSEPNASITGQVESVLKKLAAAKPASLLSEIILLDKQSKIEVSHRDIGQGISQVLPVLVSAYASENQIIAIEQPELHLHPALQAELGDVFIESALGERQNKFLIESHSEHLLLRIMRGMKETHYGNGTRPSGKPPIRPGDVAVLYVEPVGTRSIVREMPMNERGELIKDWPGGFFEEGLREVLM